MDEATAGYQTTGTRKMAKCEPCKKSGNFDRWNTIIVLPFEVTSQKCLKLKSYLHIFKMVRQQEMERQLGFVQVVSVVNPPELVLAPVKLDCRKLKVPSICYRQTDEKMAVILRYIYYQNELHTIKRECANYMILL